MAQMTVDQAHEIIDQILRQVRNPALTREEHALAQMAEQLLYSKAKDAEEDRQGMKDEPKIVPIRETPKRDNHE